MPDYLCISIRFLDGAFHGRADYGKQEWPPSPLRVFQAIVAASAARWIEQGGLQHAAQALQWFEQLKAPNIVTPPLRRIEATGYRLYVPDNVGDLVGKSWSRGGDDSMANYRSEKTVRPTLLQEGEAVHYLWPLAGATDELANYCDILFTSVRSITHVGWGVDIVVADASVLNEADAAQLQGKRYSPTDEETDRTLRVPQHGTLDDLENRHHAFLNRVSEDDFAPVPPLNAYAIANYRAEDEPPRPPRAVFALRQLDDSGFCIFDTPRRGLHVAGMLRHAASASDFIQSLGWSDDDARRIVLGHGEARGQGHQPVQGTRFAFLPLPSIEWRGENRKLCVGSIRRVAVMALGDCDRESFRRFTRQFAGQTLIDQQSTKSVALLSKQPENDGAIDAYFRSADTWATVTPVILPGYDDPRKLRQRLRLGNEKQLSVDEKTALLLKLDKRIDFLLRKAIQQAGFSEALARNAELEWRSAGFWPGTELASNYAVPEQHRRYRRLHVQIRWRSPDGQSLKIPGPICIGGGKHSGIGLFASV